MNERMNEQTNDSTRKKSKKLENRYKRAGCFVLTLNVRRIPILILVLFIIVHVFLKHSLRVN